MFINLLGVGTQYIHQDRCLGLDQYRRLNGEENTNPLVSTLSSVDGYMK